MNALALYRLATRLGGPLFEVALRRRARRAQEDPARLPERRGRPSLPRPPGPLLWLHGASVGEAQSVLPLLQALLTGRPGLEVLVTTGTVTSARLMAERLPARARHQFAPLDRPAAWRRFLEHWRPQLLLLVELELWPNLILESRRRGVAMALINARMSARSERRWQHLPGASVDLLGGFELCLAQSGLDRDRLRSLGAGRVEVIGNLKAAGTPSARPGGRPGRAHAGAGHAPARPRGQHPSERGRAAARGPSPPRRPAAGAADDPGPPPSRARSGAGRVAREPGGARRAARPGRAARRRPRPLPRRHARRARPALPAGAGRLRSASRWSPPAVAINLLEPARLGCPVLFGPHMANFAQPVPRLLEAGGARQVGDAGELATTVAALLEAPAARATMAAQARSAAEQGSDALGATLAALAPLLERHLGPADAGA